MTTSDPRKDRPDPTATEELASLITDADLIGDQIEQRPMEVPAPPEEGKPTFSWATIIPALAVVLSVVAWGLIAPDSFAELAAASLTFVVGNFGWAFVIFGTVFVIFMIAVAASKFGAIKLGRDDEAPEFRTVSWISMMFAAGMGIGLMFYGATEPLTFYREGVPAHQPQEVGTAMSGALFHWTLHPWALYGIVGMAIAYAAFRRGRRQLISSTFVPLLGERRVRGFWGKLIDVLAIIATVFGTATSLGVGTLQIQAGLEASGLGRVTKVVSASTGSLPAEP